MFNRIFYDRKKSKIHLWETMNNKRLHHIYEFEHNYYIEDPSCKSQNTDVFGKHVIPRKAPSKRYTNNLIQQGIYCCEADLPEEFRFLHNRYEGVQLEADISNFNICFLDIEIAIENEFPFPDKAKYPINLITMYFSKSGNQYTLGACEYNGHNPLVKNYMFIPDEQRMMKRFVDIFRKEKPDFHTGWNSHVFDIPYIVNRCRKIGVDYTKMSPLNIVDPNKYGEYIIAGVADLDYLLLYKKFTFDKKDSYTLQAIGQYETGEGKVDYEGTLYDAYKEDWDNFVDYNVQDVLLVVKIEAEKKFLELVVDICYQSLIPFDRIFSTIAMHTGYAMGYLHKQNMVMPPRASNHGFSVPGAYVHANPGFYEYVVSFDVTSLYPFEIMTYNIGPETLRLNPTNTEGLIKTPLSESDGVWYDGSKQSILSQIVETIFNERVRFKNKMKICEQWNSGVEEEKYQTIAERTETTVDVVKELSKEIHEEKGSAKFYDSQQHIRKIMINSLYGACGNEYFHFYNPHNAKCITQSGKHLIQYLSNAFNDYFREYFWLNKKYFPVKDEKNKIERDVVILIDTDSVVGSTIIDVNEKKQTIEDFYNNSKEVVKSSKHGDIKRVCGCTTPSFNRVNYKIENNSIKYVMKHTIKKRMFQITTPEGKSIKVTKDHSIEVLREGKIQDVSPKKLRSTDEIIVKIKMHQIFKSVKTVKISDCNVKDLGIQEIDVYDVEVENNHNFFGNDILVHNSNYVCLEEIIEKLGLKFNSNEEFHKWSIKFIQEFFEPFIDKILNIYVEQFGTKQLIHFKREKIISQMMIIAKKHYATEVLDKEGTVYDAPKLKVTGIEIVKTSTPIFIRKKFKTLLENIFTMRGRKEYKEEKLDEVRQTRKEFEKAAVSDIAKPCGITDYDKYGKSGEYYAQNGITYPKKCPPHHKAAINYNYLIASKNLKLLPISNGTKMKYVSVKKNNKFGFDRIAFINKWPQEFNEWFDVDYHAQWDSVANSLVQSWFNVLGWGVANIQKCKLQQMWKRKK